MILKRSRNSPKIDDLINWVTDSARSAINAGSQAGDWVRRARGGGAPGPVPGVVKLSLKTKRLNMYLDRCCFEWDNIYIYIYILYRHDAHDDVPDYGTTWHRWLFPTSRCTPKTMAFNTNHKSHQKSHVGWSGVSPWLRLRAFRQEKIVEVPEVEIREVIRKAPLGRMAVTKGFWWSAT